ncbi:uncharacterized protein Z518_06834 [Rhinocladiella mackenziei CBS 650.93]|uniref:Tail specific protease domain-containing protein n=1 Tax=Rhinocladiella mackenziei CBS 650.93 TaxID=1442369 RepID=A0A0D2FMN1_9EURO|nr:uncharacterized protein Z518_06834 [Rhinocladiella mackenziei CBS 650.93]KIX03282.1 hypothetical protein Z518_06834 [Rhinocladiella mackenziei CBS 650.93]
MRSVFFTLGGLGIACAKPIRLCPSTSSTSSTSTREPCAKVSASSVSYLAATPTAVAAVVDGQLFHECLESIPIDKQGALDQLHSLKPYIELQSTLPYLANPPDDYPQSAIDIQANLDRLIENVSTGTYSREYDFQTDLYHLFLSARDGHFSFIPDLFGVGSFTVPDAALVSISLDGFQLPQVYLRHDIVDFSPETSGESSGPEKSYMPSPVTSINDIPVLNYLSTKTEELPFHDPDAAYNFLFSESAQIVQFGPSGHGAFVNPTFYPGRETVIGFENGTIIRIPTVANIHASFDGVSDGSSAYQTFCVREEPQWPTGPPPPPQTDPSSLATIPFYPPPIVQDSENHVAGYFLNNSMNDDTAVLSILNFDAQNHPDEFQRTIATFLEKCRETGKTKLIIDVFANGGGIVELGLDTFVQLFPNLDPVSLSLANMRASETLNQLGLGHSPSPSRFNNAPPTGEAWDVRSALTPEGLSYANWPGLYGPVPVSSSRPDSGCENFQLTNTFQPNPHVMAPPALQLTKTNISAQPVFAPSNILLLADGFCASTCAIFAELLKTHTQGLVRSVAVGGRPAAYTYAELNADLGYSDVPVSVPAPMQVSGTTKGRAFWPFRSILSAAQTAEEGLARDRRENANVSALEKLSDLPLRRTLRPEAAGVNGVNHIRVNEGHGTGLPLQFVRDDAEFRLFFTRDMLVNQMTVWERVAGLVFGDRDEHKHEPERDWEGREEV